MIIPKTDFCQACIYRQLAFAALSTRVLTDKNNHAWESERVVEILREIVRLQDQDAGSEQK
jgi:hypothetical protein